VRQVAAFGHDFNDIANRCDEFRLILGTRRQATAECRYDASGGILTSRLDASIRSISYSSVDNALAAALGAGSRIAGSLHTGRVVNRTARCRRISRRRPLYLGGLWRLTGAKQWRGDGRLPVTMHGEAERWAESSPRGVASPPVASPQPLAKLAPTPSVPERLQFLARISATA
jgi:hypothetical protein